MSAETGDKSIRPGWDEYFMDICEAVSKRSHDENTKLGAVIVDERHRIVSTGYNGFPAGVNDSILPSDRKETISIRTNKGEEEVNKYEVITHAEANAIAASKGPLIGCTLYVTLNPCNECAKLIITSGIKRVVYRDTRDDKIFQIGRFLLKQGSVEIIEFNQKAH